MFRKKTDCPCGCGRVLSGQARAFAQGASDVEHLVDGLMKVVAPFVPSDARQREKLDGIVADGRSIERQMYATAHGGTELPSVSVGDIDSWMTAATQLISSQARTLAARRNRPGSNHGMDAPTWLVDRRAFYRSETEVDRAIAPGYVALPLESIACDAYRVSIG